MSVKTNQSDYYERAYPLQESLKKEIANNPSLKRGAIVLAASVAAFGLAACEPPRRVIREEETKYHATETNDEDVELNQNRRATRASTEHTDSTDPILETTESNTPTEPTNETKIIRRFPNITTPTDYADPDNDEFLTVGITMYPGDGSDHIALVGEIMIDDYDLE